MRKKIIREIDDLIFKQLDNFRESQAKQKIDETLNTLSEQQLKIVSQAGSYLIIALPLLLVLGLFISNSMLRSKISLKEEILSEIKYYNSKKSEVESVGRRIISPHKVLNRNDMTGRIRRLAQRKDIGSKSLVVANFEALEQSGNISKSEASINVRELTSKNLSDLILGLLQSEKVKIHEIKLKRDKKKKLISGNLKITHYGKVTK
jgi:hypothetical protein